MSQYDVYQLRGGSLVVRVQSDLGVETPYVLCAPLVLVDRWQATRRLHIPVTIDRKHYYIVMTQMAAIAHHQLEQRIASLSEMRDEIKRALDLLIDGF